MAHIKKLAGESCVFGKIFSYAMLCGSLCLLIILVALENSYAGSQVTARYIVEGNTVILEIGISKTGPDNIIVAQRLPGGNAITRAVPAFSAYHAKKARAKWLLKDLKPGTHKITLQMEGPVDREKISANISYMDPETGRLSRIKVKP